MSVSMNKKAKIAKYERAKAHATRKDHRRRRGSKLLSLTRSAAKAKKKLRRQKERENAAAG